MIRETVFIKKNNMDNFENFVLLPLQLEEHVHQEAYTSVRNGAPHVIQLDRSCLSILLPF
jgi:hypothetical protein